MHRNFQTKSMVSITPMRHTSVSYATQYQNLTSLLSITKQITTPFTQSELCRVSGRGHRVLCASSRPHQSPSRKTSAPGKKGGAQRQPVFDVSGPTRLNKAIAGAGVASRRNADDIIFEGRVSVNGKVVDHPGFQVDLSKDKVRRYSNILYVRQLVGTSFFF